MKVSYVVEPPTLLTGGQLGTFEDVAAVPDVGETVVLQGKPYVVQSRTWTPASAWVQIAVTTAGA